MAPFSDAIARLFEPLAEFYAEAGLELPQVQAVDASAMPEPYRRLLVHDRDMTSTLEEFFGQPMSLRLIRSHRVGDSLHREVVLVGEESGMPTEFGAIRIELNRFPPDPRKRVEEAVRPLGTILNECEFEFRCRPNGYFRLDSEPITEEAFALTSHCVLYGRHNMVYDARDGLLAEVVEILPPIPGPSGS